MQPFMIRTSANRTKLHVATICTVVQTVLPADVLSLLCFLRARGKIQRIMLLIPTFFKKKKKKKRKVFPHNSFLYKSLLVVQPFLANTEKCQIELTALLNLISKLKTIET